MNLIFSGSGEFGLPTLRALLDRGHRIVTVISQPDRPAGRGKKLTPTPIAQFALERGLPLVRTPDINAEALPPADAMVVIAFGQKVAPRVVDHPRLGSINLHASLLPRYRGAAPINWAIVEGQSVTGNSVIRLAQKMDAGAILAQSPLAIGELETAGELHDRLANHGAPLVLEVLEKLASGNAIETPQNESQATLAPKITRDAARIDWSRPAREIACRIRGFYPWPGCHGRLIGPDGEESGRVTLVRAAVAGPVAGAAGTVVDESGIVAAGDSVGVRIVELQPEGKRPMTIEAYRNGHRFAAGMRIVSL